MHRLTSLLLGAVLAAGLPGRAEGQGVREGYVAVDGARLHYEVRGHGPAIVLIHGGFMDGRMWEPQMDALAAEFTVIRYDQRGAGRTEADAATPYGPADDLLALLDTLAIDRAVIVGLSAGGYAAFDFALAHPERVAGLVAAETMPNGSPLPPGVVQAMMTVMSTMATAGRDSAVSLFLGQPVFAGVRRHPEALAQVRTLLRDNLAWPIPARYLTPPAATRLRDLVPPVLVLLGDEPAPGAEEAAEAMLRDIPRSRLVRIPGAGHMLNLEAPAAFNRAVAAFARETAP